MQKNAEGFATKRTKRVLAYSCIFAPPALAPDPDPVTVPSHRAPGGAKNINPKILNLES